MSVTHAAQRGKCYVRTALHSELHARCQCRIALREEKGISSAYRIETNTLRQYRTQQTGGGWELSLIHI
eukprot:693080-Rhodomonas_salina.2